MGIVMAFVLAVGGAATAQADAWLPHPAGARWQYVRSDTTYNPGSLDLGTMSFQDTPQGLLNTGWNSCPPPSSCPTGLLCPAGMSPCPDSLAGFLYPTATAASRAWC
jgi:hypothetical protein